MDLSAQARRQAYGWWLRTGHWPTIRTGDGTELKFNPWHDPDNGQFTFSISGTYASARWSGGGFRGGGGGSGGGAGASSHESWGNAPKKKALAARAAIGSIRVTTPASRAPGSGAPAMRPGPAERPPGSHLSVPRKTASATSPIHGHASDPTTALHREVRDGYEFQIDSGGQVRRASGEVTLAERLVRSRKAQAQAGGADRRSTDDGGHYIAARFNGPIDAFNHFAQDANFNRGGYRLLENQLAQAKLANKRSQFR